MKVSQLLLFSSIYAVAFSALVIGAETDQFSRRNEILKDSAALLNAKANKAITVSIERTNLKGQSCNEVALYKELREFFNNHVQGELTKDVLTDVNIEKRALEFEESVYRDWTPWDGAGMGISFLSKSTMSGVMRVGEQTIGTDKLEHMFGQGFQYFKRNYLSGKGEIKAVKNGIAKEKIYLGGSKLGNGVFSYGDLSANFNGMRMWNHMLQLHDDVLGKDHNIGPYIECVNDKWTQIKEIDFTNYIDDSMDESINCSKFPTQHTADKFEDRLRIMGLTCPVDRSRLLNMKAKYRQMSRWIINLDGPGKFKYFSEFRN
jgi:hypothetical protein